MILVIMIEYSICTRILYVISSCANFLDSFFVRFFAKHHYLLYLLLLYSPHTCQPVDRSVLLIYEIEVKIVPVMGNGFRSRDWVGVGGGGVQSSLAIRLMNVILIMLQLYFRFGQSCFDEQACC